jgi:hypothetical protein
MALETIKTTWTETKQRVTDLGKKAEAELAVLRTRASTSFADATGKLRGRLGEVTGALRLDMPTADDFKRLRTRVEDLADRLDRLARERVAQATAKVTAHAQPTKRPDPGKPVV